jgi:hypothetical protein
MSLHVLVAVSPNRASRAALKWLARALGPTQADVTLLHVWDPPNGEAAIFADTSAGRALVDMLASLDGVAGEVHARVEIGRQWLEPIWEAVAYESVDLVVLACEADEDDEALADEVAASLGCDVVVVSAAPHTSWPTRATLSCVARPQRRQTGSGAPPVLAFDESSAA